MNNVCRIAWRRLATVAAFAVIPATLRIAASNPLAALPAEFKGEGLALRIHFDYNQAPESSTR
jgi:hypothetical protein